MGIGFREPTDTRDRATQTGETAEEEEPQTILSPSPAPSKKISKLSPNPTLFVTCVCVATRTSKT